VMGVRGIERYERVQILKCNKTEAFFYEIYDEPYRLMK